MKPLIITGCQRSGTAYTAALITACGYWCSHERFFSDCHYHEVRPTTCEASWAAAALLSGVDAHVVFLVRHPLDAISSYLARRTFVGRMRPSAQWATKFVKIDRSGSEIERATQYWLRWNRLAAGRRDDLWRLEDLSSDLIADTLTRFGRTTSVERVDEALKLIPTTVNESPRPTEKLTWSEIPNVGAVCRRAELYGYTE